VAIIVDTEKKTEIHSDEREIQTSHATVAQAHWAYGLTSTEAELRLREQIDLAARSSGKRRVSALLHVARRVFSPLAIILIIASIASAVLGDRIGASIILVIVTVSAALDFAQTYHSQRAADRLQRQVASTATVKRDGEWIEILPEKIVAGDRIRIQAGDLIPGDAVVVSTTGLYVQQSALTGEALPVEKRAVGMTTAPPPNPNDPSCIFQGSSTAVLRALYGDTVPRFTLTSVTAPGVSRSFDRLSDLVADVINGRVYEGVHYRTSGEAGAEMGRRIGEYTVRNYLRPL